MACQRSRLYTCTFNLEFYLQVTIIYVVLTLICTTCHCWLCFLGGYHDEHPVMRNFWTVVSEFSDVQKRQLLKFVTSCSRPPLLGFKVLSLLIYVCTCLMQLEWFADKRMIEGSFGLNLSPDLYFV